MKGFLFDQNLPGRFTFAPSLPIVHATALGPSPTDTEIWLHAREHDLVIVTKDADFSDRMILARPPPRVVRLCFGSLRRTAFHALLASVWPQVEGLLVTHKLVNVYADRLEAVE